MISFIFRMKMYGMVSLDLAEVLQLFKLREKKDFSLAIQKTFWKKAITTKT